MAFTLEDIEHLAALARLKLSDEEKEMYQAQLADILAYFDVLQKLDTSGVPPTASILPKDTTLRPDAVRPSLPPETVLANLDEADREANQYRVDAILEG
ncbi:MAG: Asp-tRNA(Asn)/Glu-tRNA(Gln) amidotransferase subunit GatC [Chloroflexi bacterium]|nr:Asp-tRNA(Asn)/Glu-tRNA(Gln) amidotransferase subunit GatC [Chloroflexota bacterium]